MGVSAFMAIGIADGMLDDLTDPPDSAFCFFECRPGKNDRG
jgi:hypothetical protein